MVSRAAAIPGAWHLASAASHGRTLAGTPQLGRRWRAGGDGIQPFHTRVERDDLQQTGLAGASRSLAHALLDPASMHRELLTTGTILGDEAAIVVGCGPFAARVLELVRQEFAQRGVPAERAGFLAFDATAGRTSEPAVAGTVRLDVRGTAGYLTAPGNEALRTAVSHVPDCHWPVDEAEEVDLPALGFVTFHRYDETLITSRLRAALEAMRARNPQERLRCLVVGSLGEGLAAGMTAPLLLRVRDLLQRLKVRLDVVLVTGEAAVESGASSVPRNCVAQAMLWEALQAGTIEFHYAGKEGLREARSFGGPLAPPPYVFSGGVGDTHYGETATASAIATCIASLLLTRLGDDLVHREDAFRGPEGENGAPPHVATMNVGGVQLHAFPSLLRLRAVRSVLNALTRTPEDDERTQQQRAASEFRAQIGLTNDAIVAALGLGARPLTRDELQSVQKPREKLYEYVRARLDEDLGALLDCSGGSPPTRATEALLAGARSAIATRGHNLINGADASVTAAVLFYATLEQEFDAARQAVVDRAGIARLELGRTPDRERLDILLERLRRDTAPPGGRRGDASTRFAATVTVSVATQLRKIREVAGEIRAHALVLAEGALLSEVYARMARFCEQQREELQGRLYVLNQLGARCVRAEEMLQRSARAALTYKRGHHEALIERLWAATCDAVRLPAPPEVIARLGGDLLAFRADAPDALDRLLNAIPVDEAQLAALVDTALAADAEMTAGLRAAETQLFPGAQVDRDTPHAAASRRSRLVLCTARMYAAHAHGLFAGYEHLETSDPYAVLFVQHETGLRLMALSDMRRAQAQYASLPPAEQSLGHLTADLAASLPPLAG